MKYPDLKVGDNIRLRWSETYYINKETKQLKHREVLATVSKKNSKCALLSAVRSDFKYINLCFTKRFPYNKEVTVMKIKLFPSMMISDYSLNYIIKGVSISSVSKKSFLMETLLEEKGEELEGCIYGRKDKQYDSGNDDTES